MRPIDGQFEGKIPSGRPGLRYELRVLIEQLAWEGRGPADIKRELDKMQADGKIQYSPDIKTVRKYAKGAASLDLSGPWSLAADDTGEPAAVLDALEAAVYATKGRVRTLTMAEARMVARIARATDYVATGLPAPDLWRLARLYVARTDRQDDTVDLDAFLALRPWKSQGDWDRYIGACDAKLIPALPWIVFEMLACGMNTADLRGEERLTEDYDRLAGAPVSNAVSSSARTAIIRDGSPRRKRGNGQDQANGGE